MGISAWARAMDVDVWGGFGCCPCPTRGSSQLVRGVFRAWAETTWPEGGGMRGFYQMLFTSGSFKMILRLPGPFFGV